MSDAAARGDESAALQFAIDSFRENAFRFKDPDYAKKRLAHDKHLLLEKGAVRTIEHGGALSIIVPETSLELHRMDEDEIGDFIAAAAEKAGVHEYLLAVAAALIENGHTLPGPLKEFVVGFLRNPERPRRGSGRQSNYIRDEVIRWVVASICLRWDFSPTRNEATAEPSAISIVKTALGKIDIHLTEAAITKIWDKRIFSLPGARRLEKNRAG